MPQNLKKGQILIVKVPPFFDQEYLYEVVGAGGKVIRVNLYKSPKVKKHWTLEEYALLCEHGMIRMATAADLQRLQPMPAAAGQDSADTDSDTESNSDTEADFK